MPISGPRPIQHRIGGGFTGAVVKTAVCWRDGCKAGVSPTDDLGLCPDCVERLRDPSSTVPLKSYELPREESDDAALD